MIFQYLVIKCHSKKSPTLYPFIIYCQFSMYFHWSIFPWLSFANHSAFLSRSIHVISIIFSKRNQKREKRIYHYISHYYKFYGYVYVMFLYKVRPWFFLVPYLKSDSNNNVLHRMSSRPNVTSSPTTTHTIDTTTNHFLIA